MRRSDEKMIKSIKTRFSEGIIESLGRLDLEEGKEFTTRSILRRMRKPLWIF